MRNKTQSEPFIDMMKGRPKNRRSQLLVIAAVLLLTVGGVIATYKWIGFVVLALGFTLLIGVTIWSIKNWDIE